MEDKEAGNDPSQHGEWLLKDTISQVGRGHCDQIGRFLKHLAASIIAKVPSINS